MGEIITRMYGESCGVTDYALEAENYIQMIFKDFLSIEAVNEISRDEIDVECKNTYLMIL